MADVDFKWVYSVEIADNSGALVTRFYEAPFAAFADFDAFQTAAIALDTLLLILTAGVVAKRGYQLININDSLSLPASGVENENQAFFSGKIDGDPTDSATQSIPAADPAIFVATSGPGANVVNTANASVAAWLSLFDGSPGWTISDGEFWSVPSVKGKRRHVKNSNG